MDQEAKFIKHLWVCYNSESYGKSFSAKTRVVRLFRKFICLKKASVLKKIWIFGTVQHVKVGDQNVHWLQESCHVNEVLEILINQICSRCPDFCLKRTFQLCKSSESKMHKQSSKNVPFMNPVNELGLAPGLRDSSIKGVALLLRMGAK